MHYAIPVIVNNNILHDRINTIYIDDIYKIIDTVYKLECRKDCVVD